MYGCAVDLSGCGGSTPGSMGIGHFIHIHKDLAWPPLHETQTLNIDRLPACPRSRWSSSSTLPPWLPPPKLILHDESGWLLPLTRV
jgi:hypothetical protein